VKEDLWKKKSFMLRLLSYIAVFSFLLVMSSGSPILFTQ